MDDGKVSLIAASPQSDISRFIRLCHLPHRHGNDDEVGEAVSMEVDPARVVPAFDSVVKVTCVHAKPNYSLPWQRNMQYTSTSSGFVIRGKRVLTNAHSLECYTQVRLKKRGSTTNYLATVLAIGTECDIAMLTVADDEFWHQMSPLEFREDLPHLQDVVTVLGYPFGGGTVSVTRGVVSRIEVITYMYGRAQLMALQVDAAINPGNSGGPVLNDRGDCVGIAFQSFNQGVGSIGYVIPTPIVSHFIHDYDVNGQYTGFPVLGVLWQNMANPDLRRKMLMPPDHLGGVRVKSISYPLDSMVFEPSDVILYIDDVEIGNDGTCLFRHGERLAFSYLISQKYVGGSVRMITLRDSTLRDFDLRLECPQWSVPAHSNDISRPPSYYIVGGFVLIALSIPYLRSKFGDDYANNYNLELSKSVDHQIVVVSQVLAADINIGYENMVDSQVHIFNGNRVKNLKSLATMVESCHEELLQFLMGEELMVLNTKTARAAIPDILSTYCIPSVMSDDLRP